MSGGVDSSVAAALLVEQGYQVTGVYMKNWTKDLPGMRCPWADDLADAKRVAVQLGIDFLVYDFEAEYKHHVVDYMIDEYTAGRTPNPDIMCNQEVKFKLFLEAALADGADMIATGHYARVKSQETTGIPRSALLQAKDTSKDQTYFLYRVTEQALSKTLFPLGGYTKSQVRDMARERGLWTATKKESMGVCFVGNVSMKDFLSHYVTTVPGNIVDQQSGVVLGQHDGALFYTTGQRHGLGLGGGLPYYVVGKDIAKNEVYVSQRLHNEAMWQPTIRLHMLHGITGALQSGHYQVRLRHRAPLAAAELQVTGQQTGILTMSEPQRVATPGQSVVCYAGSECVGGGIIAAHT